MRIAITTRFAHIVGGVETYLECLLPVLAATGHVVKLWHECAVPSGVPSFVPPEVETARMDVTAPGTSGVVGDVAAWTPDVVFTHGISRIDVEKAMQGIAPMLVLLHAYHGTCISGHKTLSFPTPRACSHVLGPACLARFHVRRCGGWSPLTMVRDFGEQRLRQQVLREADGVATLSAHMREEAIAHGVDPARAQHLEAFVPPLPAVDGCAAESAADDTRLHVVFAGRMDPLKGAAVLVDALTRLAPPTLDVVRVSIVGDGRERQVCEDTVARTDRLRGRVRFLGWLSRHEWAGVLSTAHLLVVPSLWPEPLGLVGLEAASMGVPSLAFDVGGIRDWLADGHTGRLVSGTPSSSALATALEDCLRDRQRLGRWGRHACDSARLRTPARHAGRLQVALAAAIHARPAGARRPA